MKYITLVLIIICISARAQQFSLTGVIADSTDNSALIGVNIILTAKNDTTYLKGSSTDVDGTFRFDGLKNGSYMMKVSYVGYTPKIVTVHVVNADVNVGALTIGQSVTTLQNVVIKGTTIQVEQKGDTVQYNANAFKTNRGATAEDLLQKMPGITSDNTGVKAQGEAVQKILLDGKQFFGDDATLALKNLPAEIIEKIEVFDRLSEQSQFTGFDDGQTQKTINIVTRKGKNNGQFGRVYAGAGEEGHYMAGGNLNSFRGNRRLSLVGLSNNINQQNFSSEDLTGVTSGGGSPGRGGRGGNGGAANFNVGQQNGISKTTSAGLNYTDQWGKKMQVTGSYFFNHVNNNQITNLNRQYITRQDSGLVYSESSVNTSTNNNHRIDMRLEYTLDTANSFVLTPKFSYQGNDSRSAVNGNYAGAGREVRNNINNSTGATATGYNFSNNVLYRHRFAKRGRSLSWNIGTEINSKDGDTQLYSFNRNEDVADTIVIDQHAYQLTSGYTLSSSLSYTEPIGKYSQLQFNYSPSVTKSNTYKDTYNMVPETNQYSDLDTLLTNRFKNTYVTQRGGASYRFNNRTLSIRTEMNLQRANLNSDQNFPREAKVDRSFTNLLPQASINYKFSKTENLRFRYRTSTNAPSISQLQNVVDNRNPLFLKAGNTNLKQNYTHNITIRYGNTNVETSTSFLVYLTGNFTNNYITNSTFIAPTDTVFNGITLPRGAQLTYPVNMNGYSSTRALLTYGLPVALIKSNVNVSTGFTYNRTPALINNVENRANNMGMNAGMVVSSNISESIDFTVSYTANYTIVKNSLQKQSDNNYFNHLAAAKFNWLFYRGFVFNTNFTNTLYKGLSAQYDRSVWLLNASLGYKFMKDKRLEFKVTAFDILNQNKSISRNVTEIYIEDQQTNVLNRYFMAIITYTLRNFNR